MAAAVAISERVYQAIRMRVLSGGFRLRERLDVARLASELNASATPVREALTRLAAERLIEARPARGFFAALWSRAELTSLYEWRMTLAVLATQASERAVTLAPAKSVNYADRIAQCLAALEQHANTELKRAAANTDDRLYAARRAEPEAMTGCEAELAALEICMEKGARREIVSMLRRYHVRRIDHVGAIRDRAVLRALPSNGE